MHYEGMIYRPPSEAYSLILQVTVGCAHNQCTFCSMYKDKQFHLKSLQDIEADLQEAQRFYGSRVERIFLADGDALVLSTEKLTEILNFANHAAALTCTRPGAIPAMPTLSEVLSRKETVR